MLDWIRLIYHNGVVKQGDTFQFKRLRNVRLFRLKRVQNWAIRASLLRGGRASWRWADFVRSCDVDVHLKPAFYPLVSDIELAWWSALHLNALTGTSEVRKTHTKERLLFKKTLSNWNRSKSFGLWDMLHQSATGIRRCADKARVAIKQNFEWTSNKTETLLKYTEKSDFRHITTLLLSSEYFYDLSLNHTKWNVIVWGECEEKLI